MLDLERTIEKLVINDAFIVCTELLRDNLGEIMSFFKRLVRYLLVINSLCLSSLIFYVNLIPSHSHFFICCLLICWRGTLQILHRSHSTFILIDHKIFRWPGSVLLMAATFLNNLHLSLLLFLIFFLFLLIQHLTHIIIVVVIFLIIVMQSRASVKIIYYIFVAVVRSPMTCGLMVLRIEALFTSVLMG